MSTVDTHCQQVEALYAVHHGWLRGWLCKKLGCTEQAADLAQDTFLRILSARHGVNDFKQPRAYLTLTAKRLMIDRVRRQQIEQAYLAELVLISEDMACVPSPEEINIAIETLAQFSEVLLSLAANVREAFLLHYLHEKSQAEIAAALGVSVRMVQKYLAQALLGCQRVLRF
jgi:RNA polymerase sigma factor (sigma-70 family)